MAILTYKEAALQIEPGESVLETLLKSDIDIPNSCRQGICQACLLRCLQGDLPNLSQDGLKNTWAQQGYFLACRCYPTTDLTVCLPDIHNQIYSATVVSKQLLTKEVVRLTVQVETEHYAFFAGQFANLRNSVGLLRSYSIANLPNAFNHLVFHIRKLTNGSFSSWVHDELLIGDKVEVSEAKGGCYYLPGQPDQPLLLIGTGTGLAPLFGIIQEALQQNHTGPIYLFHGSRNVEGLYLIKELHRLAEQHANFYFTPCLSSRTSVDGFEQGRANEIALTRFSQLAGWRIFLCGHPDMVSQTKLQAYLNGAALKDIYSDAFYLR